MADEYAVSTNAWDTPRAAAAVVIGALVFLVLIRRGFRGVSAGGVGISVR